MKRPNANMTPEGALEDIKIEMGREMETKIENTPSCFKRSCFKTEETIREIEDSSEFQEDIPDFIKIEPQVLKIETESVREQVNIIFIPSEHHETFKNEETFETYPCSQYGKREYDKDCKSPSILKRYLDTTKTFQNEDVSVIQEDTRDNIKVEPLDVGIKTETESVKDRLNVTFICDKCHGNFEDEETVKEHRNRCVSDKSNYNSNSETQTCSIPKQSFREASQLQTYNFQFHNNKLSITCSICNFACVSEIELQRHKLSHEILPGRFRCKLCTNIYSKLCDLQAHRMVHKKDPNMKCTICNINFYKRDLLQQHVTSQHNDTFACEICDMKCSKYSLLVKHVRTHTGERPFECEICGKTFAATCTLWGHKRTMHSVRSYKCNLCDKSYGVAAAYKRHLKVHSIPTEKNFQCLYDGCNRKYRTEKDRARHFRVHENRGAYKCYSCEKAFSCKLVLQRHMSCHTEEKPFHCLTCNKKFSRRDYLKKHLNSHDHKWFEMAKGEKIKIEDEQS